MNDIEAMHGDWHYMSPQEAAHAYEAGVSDDETALAVGGEGAVELETMAPPIDERLAALGGVRRVIPPISESARDELRAQMTKRYPSARGVEPGPNGQMISRGRKAAGRRRYEN